MKGSLLAQGKKFTVSKMCKCYSAPLILNSGIPPKLGGSMHVRTCARAHVREDNAHQGKQNRNFMVL